MDGSKTMFVTFKVFFVETEDQPRGIAKQKIRLDQGSVGDSPNTPYLGKRNVPLRMVACILHLLHSLTILSGYFSG
jgi:hypothetical protein